MRDAGLTALVSLLAIAAGVGGQFTIAQVTADPQLASVMAEVGYRQDFSQRVARKAGATRRPFSARPSTA